MQHAIVAAYGAITTTTSYPIVLIVRKAKSRPSTLQYIYI
jgi:hypothetical protein